MTGVRTALFQKIQRHDQCAMYHASREVATLSVKTMSMAYMAIPNSRYLMGRLRRTTVNVRGEKVPPVRPASTKSAIMIGNSEAHGSSALTSVNRAPHAS